MRNSRDGSNDDQRWDREDRDDHDGDNRGDHDDRDDRRVIRIRIDIIRRTEVAGEAAWSGAASPIPLVFCRKRQLGPLRSTMPPR